MSPIRLGQILLISQKDHVSSRARSSFVDDQRRSKNKGSSKVKSPTLLDSRTRLIRPIFFKQNTALYSLNTQRLQSLGAIWLQGSPLANES